MFRSLIVLGLLAPGFSKASTVAIPRQPTELRELKQGDVLTLPQSRLDRVSGMRPFTILTVTGSVPGAKGCSFTLYNAGQVTILNSKTQWTVEKADSFANSNNGTKHNSFLVVTDSEGRKGKLTCYEVSDGEQKRPTNIADLKALGSTFEFADEVLPSTAIPRSANNGRN